MIKKPSKLYVSEVQTKNQGKTVWMVFSECFKCSKRAINGNMIT